MIEDDENWIYVFSKMKNEGFDYCWRHYSSFEEIKDEKFHEIRKSYIEAANILEEYVKNKKIEIDNF